MTGVSNLKSQVSATGGFQDELAASQIRPIVDISGSRPSPSGPGPGRQKLMSVALVSGTMSLTCDFAVGETGFAVIVYREEDRWEADVLPTASSTRCSRPGDLSIFADLGLDEMELGVTWADLTSIAEDGSGCPHGFG